VQTVNDIYYGSRLRIPPKDKRKLDTKMRRVYYALLIGDVSTARGIYKPKNKFKPVVFEIDIAIDMIRRGEPLDYILAGREKKITWKNLLPLVIIDKGVLRYVLNER
jgi:hypothetical protein